VRFAKLLVQGDDQRCSFVAGGDELEEQVRGLGLEGDVAHLVNDQDRDAGELGELVLELAGSPGRGTCGRS
jgi:hypothetical protein